MKGNSEQVINFHSVMWTKATTSICDDLEPMSLESKKRSRLQSSIITLTSTSSDASITSDDDVNDPDVKLQKRQFEATKKKLFTKKKFDKSKSLTSLKGKDMCKSDALCIKSYGSHKR